MFSNDIFGEILDTFCNNNCDSSFLNGDKLTLAFFGGFFFGKPIYITKWARCCNCCKRHHCLCKGENRDGERDKQGAGRYDRSFTLQLLDVEPYGA